MTVLGVVKSVKPADVTPVIVVCGSPADTTGGFIERFEPAIDAVVPVEQSGPVPFWKFGTKSVTCHPLSVPESSRRTNGAMLADVSWSVPFSVTVLKLPTVGNPAPPSNSGGPAVAGPAVVTARSAAANATPTILVRVDRCEACC